MDRRWWGAALGVLSIVGVGMIFGVPLAANEVLPGAGWLGVIGMIPIVGAVVLGILVVRQRDRFIPTALGTTAVVFSTALFGIGTVAVDRYQRLPELLEVVNGDPNARIASFGVLESSWVFYSGRPVFELNRQGKEGEISRDPDRGWLPKPRMNVEQFLSQNGHHYVVTTESRLDELQDQADDALSEVARIPYFLNNENLVLLTLSPSLADRVDRVDATSHR